MKDQGVNTADHWTTQGSAAPTLHAAENPRVTSQSALPIRGSTSAVSTADSVEPTIENNPGRSGPSQFKGHQYIRLCGPWGLWCH